jgi:hypothetical protein
MSDSGASGKMIRSKRDHAKWSSESAMKPVKELIMTQSNFNSSSVGGSSSMADAKLLATFSNYAEAQRLVDQMSDAGFPVEHVRIVGEDLRTVEHVTGRLTIGKAALAGAATGAWLGLFIGLLIGLFTTGESWLWVMLTSLVLGTFWGTILGAVSHWATRGTRDFASIQTLDAGRYDVYVDASHAADAARFVSGSASIPDPGQRS